MIDSFVAMAVPWFRVSVALATTLGNKLKLSASLVSTANDTYLSVTSDQMRRGETKEFGPLSRSENKQIKTLEEFSILGNGQSKNSILKGNDIQALATLPHLSKPHVPKPPKVKSHQKPLLTACMGKIHPENLDSESQPVGYPGPEGLRFDDKGMVLPHCILGSLEDFRCYLEEKQETELVRRIPESQREPPCEAPGRRHSEAVESGHRVSSGCRNIQSNALEHWHSRMTQRKRQQDFLSDLLDRPVENLLMNQANRFREFQEQREFLNQVMPLIHSGYGYRVGSEFWSLPQRYGDEISGITATLTQTEQGRRKPVTHVGQPYSIQQESGVICAETLHPVSRTWDQSAYLQQRCQELEEVLQDMDTKKPDIDGLEVIGSGKPVTFVTVCGAPSQERQEEEKEVKEEKKENFDVLAQFDDAGSQDPLIPALRFCGQLASWTGNSATHQGEVGISATVFFQAMTGERALSHLELHNEGSTAIFYSWQHLPLPHSFPKLKSQTMDPHFYFNSSSGVILPGDTQQVEFIFKSEKPGIKTELWQLNTHPVLLQGASMQVMLRGVALYQDKTADQRLFIETKLDKIVMVKMCRSIVDEILCGIQTPERPSSPAELYITEVQTFENKNPKLQYLLHPVNNMKRLWQEVNPGQTWDLSVDTLQQVVLSLPEQDSAQDTSTREKSLALLSSLLLQLSEPSTLEHHHLTAAALGQMLWRKLLDTMADEAMRLRNLLGLPEREIWADKLDKTSLSDADVADDIKKDEKSEKKGGAASKEERSGARSRLKDDNKREEKFPSAEKSVEESKKKGKRREESEKHITEKENQTKESASLTNTHPEHISQQLPDVELEVMNTYTRLLHQKVYTLMEDLVDTLCDLMDEGDEEVRHSNTWKAQDPPVT